MTAWDFVYALLCEGAETDGVFLYASNCERLCEMIEQDIFTKQQRRTRAQKNSNTTVLSVRLSEDFYNDLGQPTGSELAALVKEALNAAN